MNHHGFPVMAPFPRIPMVITLAYSLSQQAEYPLVCLVRL